MSNKPYVLSLAGFDPSAGAGVLADIKTFELLNCNGLGVITCNTIQNESEFIGLIAVDENLITKQLEILFERYLVKVVKIGMVASFQQLKFLTNLLRSLNNDIKIIWDPILETSSGYKIHEDIKGMDIQDVFEKLYLITPNPKEENMLCVAKAVKPFGINVLLKSVKQSNEGVTDKLITNQSELDFVHTAGGTDRHGTGCFFSSAIAALLASGQSLELACKMAGRMMTHYRISAWDFDPKTIN
ncbi:MAG: hydroxymethylpyrimidine/phosphomethylpyrimidine kinase [Sphingobacteriales bacterium]|jgi:hydroxymethylpyrimidine/phosphomethylpyrimidine kinase